VNLEKAIELCRLIESFCPNYGCHVALTGGCLYKDGEHKDIDILFYRVRQVVGIDRAGLTQALGDNGVSLDSTFGWMQKMRWQGLKIDVFFPETVDSGNDAYTADEEAARATT